MSLFLAKKQEDNNQKKVRDLLRLKENKKCFDCPTKSPAFVNTTIQTFICARCSGLVREVGHRVKAVSASKFSGAELLALKKGGNGIALKIWLSNYSTHDAPEPEADADVRSFMRQKYYENKWLDRALLQSHKEEVRSLIAKSFTEDGLPIVTKSRTRMIPGFSRVPLIADNEMNIMHDDEDEGIVESSVLQNDDTTIVAPSVAMHSVPVIGMPEYSVPQQPQTSYHTASVTTSPTSPVVGRSSIESTDSYSSASSSQNGSIYSYRTSQDMVRNNTYSNTTSSIISNRQSTEIGTSQPAVTTSDESIVLTPEQIAERCRSSIDSTTSAELYQQQKVQFVPEESLQAEATVSVSVSTSTTTTERTMPPLNIEVPNRNSSMYQYHPSQYQMKSPTLVDFGNNNNTQSPTVAVHQQLPTSASLGVTSSTNKNTSNSVARPMTAGAPASVSVFDSILSDLAGLKLEKTVRRATYTGGILSPAMPVTVVEPSKSSSQIANKESSNSMFNDDFFAQLKKSAAANEKKGPENDPYAALRGIPPPVVAVPASAEIVKDEDRNTLSSSEDDDDEEDPWQEFCSSSTTNGNNEDNFMEPQQVIQPASEDPKPVTNMISVDLFSDLDPRSMFKRF